MAANTTIPPHTTPQHDLSSPSGHLHEALSANKSDGSSAPPPPTTTPAPPAQQHPTTTTTTTTTSSSSTTTTAAATAAAAKEARRTSFNFLRRQKSSDNRPPTMNRVTSAGGKMSKKQRAQAQEDLARQQREAAALARSPPRLPTHSPLPTINAFGGGPGAAPGQAQDYRPDAQRPAGGYQQAQHQAQYQPQYQQTQGGPEYHAMSSHVPIPPVPHGGSPGSRNGEDPYARTESMTHRGRYSYASSAISLGTVNSPRRVRRRKDPTPFNVLVVGAKNSGKTSFINFLRTSLTPKSAKKAKGDLASPSPPRSGTVLNPDSDFTSQYLETEFDTERVGVTLWDSQGLEKNIVDLQLREMSSFLESKFEETFTEEQKVVRAPGVRDTHIHCVFLILDPVRLDANIAASKQRSSKYGAGAGTGTAAARVVGGLDEDLDLQVLRTLQGKTTVIPVISKADTITTAHMTFLKRTVWASLRQAKLDPLDVLNISEESSDEDGDDFDERDEDRYNDAAAAGVGGRGKRRNRAAPDGADADSADGSVYGDADEPGLRSSSPVDGVAPAARSSPATSPPQHRRTASALSAQQDLAADELPAVPMSILSPDMYELDANPPGRRFPWGFADPYDVGHCDFVRLKDSVFSEWRAELREASRERWYEGWRTSRLKRHGPQQSRSGGPAGGPASRPATIGATGTGAGTSAVRSPNGRPQGIYGSPPPSGQAIGQAISGPGRQYVHGNGNGIPQGVPPPRMQSVGAAPGAYRGGGSYQ